MAEFIIVSTLNGIIYGMVLFMVSAGLTLVFGMMGVVNFAHASFYMLGAYFAYALSSYFGFWAGVVVAPMIVAIIGVIIERTLLRPIASQGHSHQILVTFGVVFILRELVNLFFGRFTVPYQIPEELRFAAFSVFDTAFPFYRILVGIVAVAMFALLYALLQWTRIGIVVRASVLRPEMAGALGHNVPMVFMIVFGVGAWLAGVGGALGGALYTTNPNIGLDLGGLVFVVVVIGGLGSLRGAMLSSLLIGLLSSFAVGIDFSFVDILRAVGFGWLAAGADGALTLPLSSFAGSLPYLLMLLVLIALPSGLMGTRS